MTNIDRRRSMINMESKDNLLQIIHIADNQKLQFDPQTKPANTTVHDR